MPLSINDRLHAKLRIDRHEPKVILFRHYRSKHGSDRNSIVQKRHPFRQGELPEVPSGLRCGHGRHKACKAVRRVCLLQKRSF
jgi:hypothetical protein